MTPQDGDLPPQEQPSSAITPVLTRNVTVPNKRGLHARAAAKFVMLAERFDASVDVIRDGQSVPARSIMGLMMLGAGPGSTILVQATGKQAREALDAITTLVENGFDEDSEGAVAE
jgi:phosphocarrier protein HPr